MDNYTDTAAFKHLSDALGISTRQIQQTLQLLQEGATIPFIARYRKERTGNLDEVQIGAIRDGYDKLQELEKRRQAILKSIEAQGKLTPELQAQIQAARLIQTLEDLYLPYKQKRKTRASQAREKGLEPLAEWIFRQTSADPAGEANRYVNAEMGVKNTSEALQGARDIMAEWFSEDAANRESIRYLFQRKSQLTSKVARGKKDEAVKYADYFDWSESLQKAPSHRLLAMLRGEQEGLLKIQVEIDDAEALRVLSRKLLRGDHACSLQVKEALEDSYSRLIAPALASEVLQEAKDRADVEAIRIFAENVKQLLMEAPFGKKTLLAIDPGFRTGCKVVVLNTLGDLIHNETIYPHSGPKDAREAENKIRHKIEAYKVEAIAIGNGTAGRETEAFIRKIKLPKPLPVIMVNESGASIYSASAVAREEFPEYDVTVRGAVSIGRRLMDPLAELVKLEPKSIGVGQYQHDVNQPLLQRSLEDVVSSCVNQVGVDVNSASKQLLTYVSGLGPALAQQIVLYRKENGPFASRKSLMEVPRMGAKAFEQCAGFLRIREAKNPLDRSAVHPERYALVEKMARDLNCNVTDLLERPDLRKQIQPEHYVSKDVGLITIQDILNELEKPGRDPRPVFEAFSFDSTVHDMKDLQPGMVLPGIVTNITAFGCFVDIGVHQDGLVHISEMADRFVKDPNEIVKLRQSVRVRVLEVDTSRKRIQLSMK